MKRPLIIGSTLVALLVAVVVAAALGSGAGPKAKKPVVLTRSPVSSRLYHVVGALTRGHGASTAVHPLPTAVAEGIGQQVGIEPSAAVYAGGSYPTWIVPGSKEICLVHGSLSASDVGGGGICGSIEDLEERGIAEGTESASGDPVVLGLVPNGNASVVVTDANGSKETVPVVNNVYEITSGDPVSATLKSASGTTTTRHLPVIKPAPASPGPTG